jgi:hypothetical protein
MYLNTGKRVMTLGFWCEAFWAEQEEFYLLQGTPLSVNLH